MPTPAVTITGTICDPAGNPNAGTVVLTLVNYGSSTPIVQNTYVLAPIQITAQAASNGTFSVTVYGNYQISPSGTYYAIAFYPAGSNADFASDSYIFPAAGTYDLSTYVPMVPATAQMAGYQFGSAAFQPSTAFDAAGSAAAIQANLNAVAATIPTQTSQLTNNSGYITSAGAPVQTVAGRTGAVTLAESDIANLPTDLAAKEVTANKGAANGYAAIDSTGHIPINQLPASVQGAMSYVGTWNASANSPALVSGTGTKGAFYKVSTAGSTTIDGNNVWHVGDLIIFDGTTWDKVDNYEAVTTVAGRTGAVTLASSDISGLAPSATTDTTNASNIASGTLSVSRLPTIPYSQLSGTPTIPSVPITTVQNNGVAVTPASGVINLVPGSNITLTTSGDAITVTSTATTSTAFSAVTGSTNTTAAMVVGSGASIAPSGTGVVNANQINGTALSGLGTGLLKNTAGTGLPTIAAAGTDYVVPSGSITGTSAGLTGTPNISVGTVTATGTVAAPSFNIGIVGAFRNLYASATGTNTNVTVTADEVVLENSSNYYVTVRGVSLTIACTGSGANGLDTGTVAASTWYSVWVIYNGTTIAGLLSLSSTAPTMPSTYTYKARIGWIRTDAVNKYPLSFTQYGRKVQYKVASGGNLSGLPLLCSGTQGDVTTPTWIGFSVVSYVPTTASSIRLVVTGTSSGSIEVSVSPNNTAGTFLNSSNAPIGGGTTWGKSLVEVMLETTTIYVGAQTNSFINVIGWEDNL